MKHCHKKKDTIIIGAGCSGGYLINKLSQKKSVKAFEAGWDRRNDGATYNLAIGAPTAVNFTQYSTVAEIQTVSWSTPAPLPGPINEQWAGITFESPYSVSTTTDPANPSLLIGTQGWSQGVMIGGSNEHIQGVYVNPSQLLCDWWAKILNDPIYEFESIFPKITAMENFRMHTDLTTQTWDGTPFGPLDGPSELAGKPKNRGYNGVIQVMQTAPSKFSINLSNILYKKFHDDLGYKKFKLTPIIEDNAPLTFNSGVNICVTTSPETWIDEHRNRSSIARGYLNDSVMIKTQPDIANPATYGGQNQNYLVNNGPYEGINGHDFTLDLNILVNRVVFKTKCGFPHGKDYWIQNYPVSSIDVSAFVRPLKAIGIEYITTTGDRIFVPGKEVICTAGVLATPIVLMQSGIGPKNVLDTYGIPVLLRQENMGKYVNDHAGITLRWTGNAAVWGTNDDITGKHPVGATASNGYLPGPTTGNKRKFQYFSTYSPTITATNPVANWSMNFYDLHNKSTGSIQTLQNSWTPTPTAPLLPVKISPQYYTDPNNEDLFNICWIVRKVAKAIHDADMSAVFIKGGSGAVVIPYPFPDDDATMLKLFTFANGTIETTAFTSQAHYVGTCGMGNNPKVHCVDKDFFLRGTRNVRVCDASSIPLDIDTHGVVYPVQNDGNSSRGVNTFSVVCAEKILNQ